MSVFVCLCAVLPKPIQESISVLQEHIYQPLSQHHIEQEEKLEKKRCEKQKGVWQNGTIVTENVIKTSFQVYFICVVSFDCHRCTLGL